MNKKITVLGSTGSIGTQTLEVAESLGLAVEALTAGKNSKLLEEQVRRFNVPLCAVADEDTARDLSIRLADTKTKILFGEEGIEEVASAEGADMVLNSLLGKAGIRPTLAAIKSGKDIAMANKEPIVAAGDLILSEVKKNSVKFIPVDSEHSAIFQCISSPFNENKYIRRLIITASGGPFFGKTREELKNVTPENAIAHPTWNMGAKISVDSATLMNKGLELIEAVRLFGVPAEQVEVTVHRQSIIHSMVEFCDSSILAQMGHPDMRHCIQFALTYPERCTSICKPMDFKDSFNLTFEAPDEKTFSLLPLAKKAVTLGGTATAAINGANEAAVDLFLKNKISFTDIFDLVEGAFDAHKNKPAASLDIIEEADRLAREYVISKI